VAERFLVSFTKVGGGPFGVIGSRSGFKIRAFEEYRFESGKG
jgi:hypothetical protein